MKRILFLLILTLFLVSCSETENSNTPTITTVDISNISHDSATSGGIITNNGGSPIILNGICWDTSSLPSISSNHTNGDVSIDTFTSNLTNLDDNTTYYVRAFATNSIGTAYGNELSFTTKPNTSPPCTPPLNSIIYNSQNHTYNSVVRSNNGLYGNYGLFGSGNQSDLRIEFSEAPVSGVYTTLGATSFIGNNECVVSGTFSNNHYVGHQSQSVYVLKNGDGLYSMTFCNLNFSSGSSNYSFSSDGNLKTD